MSRRDGWLRVGAAVAFPGAVALLALPSSRPSTATAGLAYVVAVAGAALVGGLRAGLIASLLSFLGLNYFFTVPRHTFRVRHAEDLAALLVFLGVATLVAALLSRAIAQRARAERREKEARLLQLFATKLLVGRPALELLHELAASLIEHLDLASCEIVTEAGAVRAGSPAADGAVRAVVPILAEGRPVGELVAVAGPGARLGVEEYAVLSTFGAQVALALEGARLAEDATRARMDAEASSMRAALFSSVTHDLRTPLAAITASVTSMLDASADLSPESRTELLRTISEEAHRLNRLVGNLLDLARVRAGQLDARKRPTSMNEVIEGVVARLQPQLDGRDVRLLLREDLPDLPLDVDLMDQVLMNLLENAARYSPPGSAISVTTAEWQGGVEVRVADRGPGIPPDERERVFESFVRATNAGAASGTGLGLAIARALVEAHGGRIWIEDAPGGGAAVLFRLPEGSLA